MAIRFLWLFVLVSSGITLTTCSYIPDEDYIKKIQEVDPDQFTVSLNSYDDADTIYLSDPATFEFNIENGAGVLSEVRVMLNGNLIGTYQSRHGQFTLQPPLLKAGIFELKIAFTSTSGTGSLADQAGGEVLQVWRTWVLNSDIDLTYPPYPSINFSEENGYLVVNWSEYYKKNFVHYRLDVNKPSGSKTYYFTDSTKTSWMDSTYAGYTYASYRITFRNKNGEQSREWSISNPLTFTASYNPADSLITVNIPKPTFYSVVQSFKITESSSNEFVLTNFNQLTYKFKPAQIGYNYSTTVGLEVKAIGSPSSIAYASQSLNVSVLTKSLATQLKTFDYNAELNSIVGYQNSGNNGKFYIFNADDFSSTRTIDVYNGPGYSVPLQSPYVYFSRPTDLVQLNLSTLEEKTMSAIKTTYGSGPSKITGAHNQLVSYAWFGPVSQGTGVIYYRRVADMTNDNTIAQYQSSNINDFYTISEDGQYVYSQPNIVSKIVGGQLQTIGALSPLGTLIGFRKDQCDEIITYAGSMVYIYDTNTLSLKRTVSCSSAYASYRMYDVATRSLIFADPSNKKLYAVNIDTGLGKVFNIDVYDPVVVNGFLVINGKEYLKLY